MKNSPESLKQYDYNEDVKKLLRKSAELKEKSKQLNAQLHHTLEQCEQVLHPRTSENSKADDK